MDLFPESKVLNFSGKGKKAEEKEVTFHDLQPCISLAKKNKERDEFRRLISQALKVVDDPFDAKWLYEQVMGDYSTFDFRFQAMDKCFRTTVRRFLFDERVNYNHLFWLTQELPNPLQKRWAADACLLAAKRIDQINDYLYAYSKHELYWKMYIALAENVRQIRHAVKFCTENLKGLAQSVEANMWFKRGQLVPDILPSLK
ncbi:hypothetical protein JW977_02570 [Candidatus Falkowbacteria bacterium]|nr:hypothetical protein [Candidatus Falkowbacteria bacterium]